MKASYVEGLANHNGPESCGASREGGVEALAGGRIGRVVSREIHSRLRKQQVLRDADAVEVSEGNTGCTAIARCARIPRGQRPRASTQAPCTGTGRSQVSLQERELQTVSGSQRTKEQASVTLRDRKRRVTHIFNFRFPFPLPTEFWNAWPRA